MTPAVMVLAATQVDAKRFLEQWPALKSPALHVVTLHNLDAARGVLVAELFVTPVARNHPWYGKARDEIAPCFILRTQAFPPRTRPPRPAEARRLGLPVEVFTPADPRGDGIKRAAELITANAPIGQVAAVLRDAAKAYTAKLFRHLAPSDQIGVDRVVSMFPEAVKQAGQVVALPPAVVVDESDLDDNFYIPPRVKRRDPMYSTRSTRRVIR